MCSLSLNVQFWRPISEVEIYQTPTKVRQKNESNATNPKSQTGYFLKIFMFANHIQTTRTNTQRYF